MKSHYLKRRGHTYATVTTPQSDDHLNPNSSLHAMHRELAKKLKSQIANQLVSDVTTDSVLTFPSLGGGRVYDANGLLITDTEFAALLRSVRRNRSRYFIAEKARNGAQYTRRRKINPLRQLAITVFPAHAMALSSLDANRRGQPPRNMLGVGRVATMRLVHFGIWLASDATGAIETLAQKTQRAGVAPIDWHLSQQVDRVLEEHFKRSPELSTARYEAFDSYRRYAQAVRDRRPDVVSQKNVSLQAELDKIRSEFELLKNRLFTQFFGNEKLLCSKLEGLLKAVHMRVQNGSEELLRDGHGHWLTVDADGQMTLDPDLEAFVRHKLSAVAHEEALALRNAYDELKTALALTREIKGVDWDKSDHDLQA